MEFNSCFDIIGPIMVGPSSSHTAGAVSIGKFVYEWLGGCPDEAEITLYGSFAKTYQGHGTDKALVGGLLGMATDDVRIKRALEIAEDRKINFTFQLEDQCPYFDHPNTTVIQATKGKKTVKVGGASIGGGLSKIFRIGDQTVDVRLGTDDDLSSVCQRLRKKEVNLQ
jgi:L-serine dehydratase